MIGTLLKDTYRVVEPLSEGGMGTLYVAEHKTLPKRYAVKVLKSAGKASTELLTRFEREARIASGLGHPNIVEVLDFDRQPDGSPFIVMELLDGEDLAARLYDGGAMDPAALLPVCRGLCAALAAAHGAGIVHRDLKPQNVFLHRWGDEELVKVLDFGISKMAGGQTDLTADSAIIGTAHYMAPEQARGSAAKVDGRADLFSLGAIVFECLTDKRAFDGGTLPEIIHALCYGERPTLFKHRPELSDALDPVLAKLLAVERDARYATAQMAWNELAPALGGEATTLPLGRSAPTAKMNLDATVTAPHDPALDATVASDSSSPPGSVVATRAESPRAGKGMDASPATPGTIPAALTESASAPPRRVHGRTQTVIMALLGIALLVVGVIAARSCLSVKVSSGPNGNPQAPTTPHPGTRPPPSKHVTLALLPGKCEGQATDIAESLRESKLKDIKGLLLPPDEIDRALQALADGGGSRDGMERRVGQRLGAMLLASSRCVGKQVKVRLVRVRDGRVAATKLVDQPINTVQRRDLVSLILFERNTLLADLETTIPAASKAFKDYIKLVKGGIHPGNFAEIIKSLELAHQADPAWERPRGELAGLLAEQFNRSWDPSLLPRIESLVAPLVKPNGDFEGQALALQGNVAFFREDIALALQGLNRAATLLPNSLALHRARSRLYMLMGDPRLAQVAMQKAVASDPDNTFNAVQIASGHWISGEFEAALKALGPYVAAQDRQHRLGASDPDLRLGKPRSEGAHALRGMLLLSLGRIEPANKELQLELAQLSTSASFANARMEAFTYFGVAIIGRLQGNAKQSRRAHRRAERALKKHLGNNRNPNLPITNMLWVVAPLSPDWITPLLDRYARPKQPFYADVLVARAGALARLGKEKEARRMLAQALAAKPMRAKGLRKTYRRFLHLCRKIDQHWKKQGRKPFKPKR